MSLEWMAPGFAAEARAYTPSSTEKMMRTRVHGAAAAVAALLSGQACAEDAKLKTGLMEARSTLVTMTKDPAKRDAAQQAMVRSSADDFSKMLVATTPPAGKEAAFKELTETWAAFKKTREDELVPDVLAGKQAEADRIASGIQKQRYEKMMSIIGAM